MRVAEVEARRLLDFLSITPIPTSLQSICENLNISLVFLLHPAVTDAMYLRGRAGSVIVINDSRSLNRKRFSLAHELGHYQLGHGPVSFMTEPGALRSTKQETQANYFAAELLMPRRMLRKHGHMTPAQITSLCGVSLEAARIRAEQLGWMG